MAGDGQVTFAKAGGFHGLGQQVLAGEKVRTPTTTKDGYAFLGWYLDADYQEVFDFNTLVSTNLTLYAKWTEVVYTITFETCGGDELPAVSAPYTATISAPTPTRAGYIFFGWYQDENYQQEFDSTQPITSNLTLYAKWMKDVSALCGYELAEDEQSYIIVG